MQVKKITRGIIMARTLFTAAGGTFRGNLHGHSTHSDGSSTPAEAVQLYKGAGYDFTCLSDHLWTDRRYASETMNDATALDQDDFITVISAELHCLGKAYDQDGVWHIVANGLPADFTVANNTETGPELVRRAVDAGAYVTIAHPEWYSMTTEEALSLAEAGAHGVEIYNHSCFVGSARSSGIATVDQLLNDGYRMSLTATDDSHQIPHDAFGGWVEVGAASLTSDAIVAALKAGDFYASTGPDFLSIILDGNQLHVTTTPVSQIILSAKGHLALSAAGDGMTETSFDLGSLDTDFFRLTITDANRLTAWSNAYWLDDWKQQ